MNIKRDDMSMKNACRLKKLALLVLGAFVFATPFMTKNLVFLPFVNAFCGIFGWCGLSTLFIHVFDFQKSLKRVSHSLFCFFFAFYFFVYSWFVNLYPLDFAGLGNAESAGVIIIALTAIPVLHAFLMTLCMLLGYAAARGMNNTFLRAILVAFGYVLGEYVQSLGTFAFPWARLFVGQTAFPEVLQSAALFGSYFITFIMVLVNALIAFSLLNIRSDIKKSRIYALVALCVFAANIVFGIVRIGLCDYSGMEEMRVLVLQGNIPSSEKWTGNIDEEEIYRDLAESYNGGNVDIAVMPETAFPVTLYTHDGFKSSAERTLSEIAKILDAELFTGAFGYQDGNSYNSIFVYDKNGPVSGPYNKRNIVPFGEFLPYRNLIEKLVPSLAGINMLSDDIARGENFAPLETKSGRAACLVCFDSIFPETARKQIKNGGEFIVIATNDSWYKTSAAIYQHSDHAIMRAIENNVPVIRCANTGISRIIDSCGRVVGKTGVNKRTVLEGKVYLANQKSLYTEIGDIIVLFGAVLILLCLIFDAFKGKKSPRM